MERKHGVLITLFSLGLASALWCTPIARIADGFSYDWLLKITPIKPTENNVIVVGIDDESLGRYPEPLVMWHEQLASVITSASESGARCIGIDLIPAVTMGRIAPEMDLKLMQSFRFASKQNTKLILGFSVGQHGMLPEKKFSMLANGLGFLNFYPDRDNVVRKQTVILRNEEASPAFSMAALLTMIPDTKALEAFNDTYVNYRLAPAKSVSLAQVLQLIEANQTAALRELFQGKVVLVGVSSYRVQDLHKIPPNIGLGSNGLVPGVQIHAYMIQSILDGSVRKDAPLPFNFLLLILLGGITSVLFLRYPPSTSMVMLTGLIVLAAGGVYAVFAAGFVLSASAALLGVLIPGMGMISYRAIHAHQFADAMRRFFSAYVNLNRLEDIMNNPRRLQQERQLKKAIERKEHYLCYQPKIDLETGGIAGFEALVRWRQPNGDFISPMHFIPLAEETGLMTRLTELIVDKACTFVKRLEENRPEGKPDIPAISINLSARDIERPDIVRYLIETIRRHGINPRQLDLEITESSFIHNLNEAISKLTELRQAGFAIAIDDFGAGQSSLGHITQIPFDTLKIDKSFFDDRDNEKRIYAVVGAIIAMSNSLHTKVVAEGIDNTRQLDMLRELKCHQVQGYIFSRPLEEEQALEIFLAGKIFVNH